MDFNINNIIDSKILLIFFALYIFINYIMEDNYKKIIIKY